MGQKIKINDNWIFLKENVGPEAAVTAEGEKISLPHTWNAVDGQDGGNDYYRGTCWYVKKFTKPDLLENEEAWLEFRGVGMTAEVYVNGKKLARHEGGYSTFRVPVTEELQEENVLAVSVDNSVNSIVYPQKADFTFYGGIYRDVYLITMSKAHFALGCYGGNGLKVTPQVTLGNPDGKIKVEAWTENVSSESKAVLTILDADKKVVADTEAQVKDNYLDAELTVENVHLWNGLDDPYLYTVKAELICNGKPADTAEIKAGFRTFSVDPEKGFFLNGKSYPLCGVARHQDRKGVGNALTPEMHREDMELIKEIGANTIRLAHYQHDQYFYDLCDEAGMIVWAEIPYISQHMPDGRENTISQMKELVIQNYHHASIICWGLSNEITVSGGVTEDLMENHRILNDLCHKMDATRFTTMANVFILSTEDPIVKLPDIRSYNLYYGWYVGEKEENDLWFDEFHEKHPDVAMGLSEYGADATICYQTGKPEKGDYTEEYQAVYHEHMLEMWKKRPYIWAMHVWNMFDFAADGREDGGEPGVNHKGLVTFDRKIKKDAFYIYKAYLSKEPFVYLCGRRYVDRSEDVTEIKVYSNLGKVTLKVDGKEAGTQEGDKIFRFQVPITGKHRIEAVAEPVEGIQVSDVMDIRKVDEPNPDYIMEREEIVNWFDREDMETPAGYFSIRDKVADIEANPEAAVLLEEINAKMVEAYGDVAKNATVPEEMKKKQAQMPLEEKLKMAGKAVTTEMVVELNKKLNRIKK
ncbi:MAG: glycoside hydrolase family 2 TIM barrel-domain containing protein [Eubacteriales bacterium]|nr:glycoside hydrolase family 2 TIM barrel-domain containing protein [Eubacteriales bacterium]